MLCPDEMSRREERFLTFVRNDGGRREEKRDFSLRRPTHSQERMRKKKSACSVRNDGWAGWPVVVALETEKCRLAPFEMTPPAERTDGRNITKKKRS
jgi:hypothetical protein